MSDEHDDEDDEVGALARREPTELAGGDAYERRYMQGEGMVLHRAKQRAPWQLNALMGSVATLSALPVLMGLPGAWVSALFSLPLLFVVWMLFAVLRVTVSEGNVNIQYGVFGPKIPIAAIESAEPTTYKWTKFGGWGIRRSLDGEWLYNMPGDGGKAVRIVWRDAKGRRKVTLIGSAEHTKLAQAIATARKGLPAGATASARALPDADDDA